MRVRVKNNLSGAVRCAALLSLLAATAVAGPLQWEPLPEARDRALSSLSEPYSVALVELAFLEAGLRQLERAAFHAGRAGNSIVVDATEARTAVTRLRTQVLAVKKAHRQAFDIARDANAQAAFDAAIADGNQVLARLPEFTEAAAGHLDELRRSIDAQVPEFDWPTLPGPVTTRPEIDAHGKPDRMVLGIVPGQYGLNLKTQFWLNKVPNFRRDFAVIRPLGSDFCSNPQAWWWSENGSELTEPKGQREMSGILEAAGFPEIAYLPFNHLTLPLPKNFAETHNNDPGVWLANAGGATNPQSPNILHPDVLAVHKKVASAYAGKLAGRSNGIFSLYAGEPHLTLHGNGATCAGYSALSVQTFRNEMKARYGDIGTLNTEWGTDYAAFDAITPPPEAGYTERRPATALTYEYERFRQRLFLRYFTEYYQGLRAAARPVALYGGGGLCLFNADVLTAIDVLTWMEQPTCDIFGMHINTDHRNIATTVYAYSFNRYFDRPLGQFEYIWTYPRDKLVDDETEYEALGRLNTFRQLAWGKDYLDVFTAHGSNWAFYRHYYLDFDVEPAPILRPAIRWVPIMRRTAADVAGVRRGTRIVTPAIAIMQPTTSMLQDFPPLRQRHAALALHDILFPANYGYFHIPEKYVVNGHEPLESVRILFLPLATYFPPGLTARLLTFVEGGGTLVVIGGAGEFDQYGRPDGRLMQTVFPGRQLKDRPVATTHGAGTVWYLSANVADHAQTVATIADSVGRAAWCEDDAFELTLRENEAGERFLWVLNPSPRATQTANVTVAGVYGSIRDLTLGTGFPVGSRHQHGCTTMRLQLAPGGACVLALGRAGEEQPDFRGWIAAHPQPPVAVAVDAVLNQLEPARRETADAAVRSRLAAWAALLGRGKASRASSTEAAALMTDAFNETAPTTGVPKADAPIELDGKLDEWRTHPWYTLGDRFDRHAQENEYDAIAVGDTAGGQARFSITWDDDALYIAVAVDVGDQPPASTWPNDRAIVYLDVANQEAGDMSPLTYTYEFDSDGTAICNQNHLSNNRRAMPPGQMAFRRAESTVTAELRMPHTDTLLPATPGYVFQLNVRLNHYSPGGKPGRSVWRSLAFRARRPDRNVAGWSKMRLME